MGIYAITGGSSGIGARTIEILQEKGHQVINIDMKGGDICVNLATKGGRAAALEQLRERCPQGLDAMICNAGVSGMCGDNALIISLNYFGAVELAEGAFPLLKMRHGSCVITSSNSIAHGMARMDLVGLMNNSPDEDRILEYVKTLDPSWAHKIYPATKYALARWVRRVSAEWGSEGVRINAVAPGNVHTAMTDKLDARARAMADALPVPINYDSGKLMDPSDIANAIAFLAAPEAHGINGVVLFVDGGTDALLHSEKVY